MVWRYFSPLPGPLFIALTHPSSINTTIRFEKKTPLLSHWVTFQSSKGSISFIIMTISHHSLLFVAYLALPCSSLPSLPPLFSLLHMFFLQSNLNKISWEFPYSINRSGHVQALSLLTQASSPSPPFSWSSSLCGELYASNPSIKDISASLLCPIRGCDIVWLSI